MASMPVAEPVPRRRSTTALLRNESALNKGKDFSEDDGSRTKCCISNTLAGERGGCEGFKNEDPEERRVRPKGASFAEVHLSLDPEGADTTLQRCGTLMDTIQGLGDHMKCESPTRHAVARPVVVDYTGQFEIKVPQITKAEQEERDLHRLSQRQKQVDYGKNTLGYEQYSAVVPRCKRKRSDPWTPNIKQVCSKRSWDGMVSKWRRRLHLYDPLVEDDEETAEDFSRIIEEKGCKNDEEAKTDLNKMATAHKKILDEDVCLSIYEDWNSQVDV